ncbi:unnamed protein product [Citrullus colocynthis]|uniref:Uncharacterized protein n=1 Tax=Citrullus colocynthis TaxID=252529 RepID=A0ABP0YFW0_9ROSI
MYSNLPVLERIMCKLTPAKLSIHLICDISLEKEKKRREIRERIPSANIQILSLCISMCWATINLDGKHLINNSVTEITRNKNNYRVSYSKVQKFKVSSGTHILS